MKLYATDYDGTVTPEGISPAFRDSLAAWQAAGNLFGIVTGRPMSSITDVIFRNKIPVDFVIADNGGVICGSDLKPVFIRTLDPALAEKTVRCLADFDNDFFRMENAYGQYSTPHVPTDLTADAERMTLSTSSFCMKDVTEFCVQYTSPEENERARAAVTEISGGKFHALSSGRISMDIVSSDTDKCTGILKYAGMLPEKPEKIYTTGDAWNDLAMLTYPGFEGYCVETGHSEVKEAVGRTVASPRELMEKFV